MKSKEAFKEMLLLFSLIFAVEARSGHGHSSHGSSHSGHSSGHSSSHSSGYSSGHSAGHSSGHSSAHSSGHSSGHSDGSSSHISHSSGTSYSGQDGFSSPSHTSGSTYSSHDWSPPHHYSWNNRIQPSSDSSYHRPLISVNTYHPEVPSGGTFHPTGSSLPQGAVYYAQPPVTSSRSSFGDLDGSNHFPHNTITHTVYRHHPVSSSNDDRIVVVYNGSPKEITQEVPVNNNLAATELPTIASVLSQEEPKTIPLFQEATRPTEVATIAAAATTIPNELPPYGIICIPMNVTKLDPKDNKNTIEVEEIACYPAPPPPETTTPRITTIPPNEDPLESIRKSAKDTVDSLKKSLCGSSEEAMGDMFNSLCKQLNDCTQFNTC